MEIIELHHFRNDIEGTLARAQNDDVLICDQGTAVAVVSKPKVATDWKHYWEERERLLSTITVDPGWDSTQAISDDRDRS